MMEIFLNNAGLGIACIKLCFMVVEFLHVDKGSRR